MPNRNYLRGRRFEWQLKKDLESEGFTVFRTAGSHGQFDLIGVDPCGWIFFIQCKVVKNKKQIPTLIRTFKQEARRFTKDFSVEFKNNTTVQLAFKVTGIKDHTVFTYIPE